MQKTKKSKHIVLVLLLTFVSLMKCEPEESRLLAALVPKINQTEFQLTPNGQQQYDLVIELPNGSRRDEKVELRSEGTPEEELHVIGTIEEYFSHGKSVANYEAGKNGNTVKYKYLNFALLPLGLPPTALKSAAG